jgi:hypothetical protein
MIGYLEYLDVPLKIGLIIIGSFLVMQIIGEFLEFKGKVVPEFLKVRKFFSRRKQEKNETTQTLREVKQLLSEVNAHYSEDNITKRNSWMNWVNERAVVYDNSIVDITKNLADVTQALRDNTKLTEEIFIQSSRDRIIAFSTKVADENALVSMEEFNRIFKVYDDYENYLHDHNLTNGEVEIAHRIIEEAYELRLKTRSFTEYIRGYITGE